MKTSYYFNMDWNQLLWIIPPAILLGIIWYFIKLFGKMIDDFNPYSDDRKYSSELNGLTYFISIIIYPCLFVFFTYLIMDSIDLIQSIPSWFLIWIPPIVVYIIYFVYSTKIKFVSMQFFDRKDSLKMLDSIFDFLNSAVNGCGKNCKEMFFKPIKRDGFWVYVVFLLGVLNFFSTNLISIGITMLFSLLTLLLIPSNYSMKRNKLIDANIIMKNKKENVNHCKIIRVNDSSVRAKKDNKIIIINRNEVLKIEVISKK